MKPMVKSFLIILFLSFTASFALSGDTLYICYEKGISIISNTMSSPNCVFWKSYGSVPRYKTFDSIPYKSLIYAAAANAGIEPALLVALVEAESYFDTFAVSHKNAKGLCQLTDDIIKLYGVNDPFDPAQNLKAGAQHLADLLDRFKDLRLALAAYNAGSGAVVEHGGIPPYDETKNFVEKVLELYDSYKNYLGTASSSSLKK